jgi:hypothetical protein
MDDEQKLAQKREDQAEIKREIERKKSEMVVIDDITKTIAETLKIVIDEKIAEWNIFNADLNKNEEEYKTIETSLKQKEEVIEKIEDQVRNDNLEIQNLVIEVVNDEKQEENLNNLLEEKNDENFNAETKAEQYQVDIDVKNQIILIFDNSVILSLF